jgi:hypothetical protein
VVHEPEIVETLKRNGGDGSNADGRIEVCKVLTEMNEPGPFKVGHASGRVLKYWVRHAGNLLEAGYVDAGEEVGLSGGAEVAEEK